MSVERPVPSREELSLCAHDLRGTLTVIAGYAGLLRRGGLTEDEHAAALDGIDAAITRIDSLIGDTLSGKLAPRAMSTRVDLVGLAARAAADARAAYDRHVAVSAVEPVAVEGDAIALARMLENLLSNAAKYAPADSIDIAVRRSGDRAIVEVADRGPGIPASERAAVFEPFTRLVNDADVPGTGLGLTVVRSVVERLAGSVSIEDRDGGGTVVRLDLPLSF